MASIVDNSTCIEDLCAGAFVDNDATALSRTNMGLCLRSSKPAVRQDTRPAPYGNPHWTRIRASLITFFPHYSVCKATTSTSIQLTREQVCFHHRLKY